MNPGSNPTGEKKRTSDEDKRAGITAGKQEKQVSTRGDSKAKPPRTNGLANDCTERFIFLERVGIS